MRVRITLGVLCTATGRANSTYSAMEDDQMQQLLSGFTELRKEVLRQQGESNCLLARRLRAGDNLHAFKRAGNEAQFKFTKRLLDHIQEAQECMKRKNDEGYEKATLMEAGEASLVQVVCTTDAAPIYIERMLRICMAEHMALGATKYL